MGPDYLVCGKGNGYNLIEVSNEFGGFPEGGVEYEEKPQL